MASALERSLEDIIQEGREKRKQKRVERRSSSSTADGVKGSPKPAGVRKKRRSAGATVASAAGEGRWKHDKFEQLQVQVQQQGKRSKKKKQDKGSGHAKLIVSNLRDTISSDSLRTLFSPVGNVISVVLKVDQSGRSLGTAEVIMESPEAAMDVVNAFNGAKVDQQPIRVTYLKSWSANRGNSDTLVTKAAAAAARTVLKVKGESSNGESSQSQQAKSTPEKPARGRRRSGRGARTPVEKKPATREPRKSKTQEELDRELDEFLGRS